HRLIVDGRAALRVAARVRVDHVVRLRDAEIAAVDDRIVDGVTLRLLDVLHPGVVILDGIAAQPDQLRIALVELGLETRHVAQLGRADRGKVLRVREKDRPTVADPFVKVDSSLRGVRREVRRHVSDMQCHRRLLKVSYDIECFSNASNAPYWCSLLSKDTRDGVGYNGRSKPRPSSAESVHVRI